MTSRRILLHILTLTALSAATLLALAAPAFAKSYSDVPKSHWAYSYISSVTDRARGRALPARRLRHGLQA